MNGGGQQFFVEMMAGVSATAFVALCVALWHKASKLFKGMQHFLSIAEAVPSLMPRVEALELRAAAVEAEVAAVRADINELKGKPGFPAAA